VAVGAASTTRCAGKWAPSSQIYTSVATNLLLFPAVCAHLYPRHRRAAVSFPALSILSPAACHHLHLPRVVAAMPVMQLSTGGHYFMINFSEDGEELVESPDKDYSVQLSTLVEEKIADDDASDPVTDVFIISHGYKTDKQGAVQSYSNWMNGYVRESCSVCLSICATSLSVFLASWYRPGGHP